MKPIHFVVGTSALIGAIAIVRGPAVAQEDPQQQPQTAQEAALTDLTGYWVSVVNQDWSVRMITPPKGDYPGLPLNDAARAIADTFDPELYGGENYQTSAIIDCRAYGAANVMHMPTRLHITWDSPNVLKIETDWGEQTRLFNFDPANPYKDLQQARLAGEELSMSNEPPSLQGYSIAAWERPFRFNAPAWQRGPAGPGGGLGAERMGERQPGGSLAVLTTNLAPGWLRRNGVPYSARTRVLEHYRTLEDPTGAQWINVTIQVVDPEYLTRPFNITGDFRREPDDSNWAPHPCLQVAGS